MLWMVCAIAGIKLIIHSLGLEILSVNPLFSALVASSVFLFGFLLNGVLTDYKESERLPAELASALELVTREVSAVPLHNSDAVVANDLASITDLGRAILAWIRSDLTTSQVMLSYDRAHDHVTRASLWLSHSSLKGRLLIEMGGILRAINRIDDEGVVFRSPRDGARITLSPERSMAIQMALGADVAMAFDQCPPYPASESEVAAASRRTHAWLERCLAVHNKPDQALFGIVQGGCFPQLRRESARVVAALDLPGIAVGGVSVGEPVEEMHRIVRELGPLLPEARPHYLMGVGSLREMAIAVAQGFDLFDCVLPTRLGRHGTALVGGERWNLRNARFRHDHIPLDERCPCLACRLHSRAYLHHLIRSQELLGRTLLSLHNLTTLLRFTTAMGQAIGEGCFSEHFAPWEADSPAAHTW